MTENQNGKIFKSFYAWIMNALSLIVSARVAFFLWVQLHKYIFQNKVNNTNKVYTLRLGWMEWIYVADLCSWDKGFLELIICYLLF